ncbi:hypothetical protein [Peptostreptococcus stomatis]|uniref:hypothetical protein n=1 Tax=Peptostreptococcus stomatis TaxID=341694 RepID=UPI0026EE000D|nr:hypothetical protein [Peptostreptococcus stomatis]
MKTYVLEYNGELKFHSNTNRSNNRGYYKEELEKCLKCEKYRNYNVICIEDDLKKYNIPKKFIGYDNLLKKECISFLSWYMEYSYKNIKIKGFSLPFKVDNNIEYREKLGLFFEQYKKALNCPAFVYEKGLLECVEKVCDLLISAIDSLIDKNEKFAEKKIKDFLELFQGNSFFISDLDKSYSFRGIAPFTDFYSEGYEEDYEKMMSEKLTFFRVRTRNKNDNTIDISEAEQMLHLPYKMKNKAVSMRFSSAGLPGLYLGTTTLVCSKETMWDNNKELYGSVFIPNDKGKRLKILNLTISEALINGIYNKHSDFNDKRRKLQNTMLKIYPLVIATSFYVKEKEVIKYHYLLSQTLMKVANSMGIDGVAYLSMKGENEYQYPQGVNLYIITNDISENNQYSEKCRGFDVSKPILFPGEKAKNEQSYINKIYKKCDSKGEENYWSKVLVAGEEKFYGETSFGRFDDYLIETFIDDSSI